MFILLFFDNVTEFNNTLVDSFIKRIVVQFQESNTRLLLVGPPRGFGELRKMGIFLESRGALVIILG